MILINYQNLKAGKKGWLRMDIAVFLKIRGQLMSNDIYVGVLEPYGLHWEWSMGFWVIGLLAFVTFWVWFWFRYCK